MRKKDGLTKGLAIAGTVLVWLPMLIPIFFSARQLIGSGLFMFDYLMPAEVFPLALLGWALLFWAALRARQQRKLIGWGMAAAVVFLFGAQGIAVITGLANGDTPMGGWQWAVVVASLAIYILALIAIGAGGILLLRELFTKKPQLAPGV